MTIRLSYLFEESESSLKNVCLLLLCGDLYECGCFSPICLFLLLSHEAILRPAKMSHEQAHLLQTSE